MAFFDAKLWTEIGKRLKVVLPATRVDIFALQHGLGGVRLDRIANGRKGVSVETLVTICDRLDLSPNWLLMGVGPLHLSQCAPNMRTAQDLIVGQISRYTLESATRHELERTGVAESPSDVDAIAAAGGQKAHSKPAPPIRPKDRSHRKPR